MESFSELVCVVGLIFVANLFNGERRCAEMVASYRINGNKLNGNNYIHYLIAPTEESQASERKYKSTANNMNKNQFEELHVVVMLAMLQIITNF